MRDPPATGRVRHHQISLRTPPLRAPGPTPPHGGKVLRVHRGGRQSCVRDGGSTDSEDPRTDVNVRSITNACPGESWGTTSDLVLSTTGAVQHEQARSLEAPKHRYEMHGRTWRALHMLFELSPTFCIVHLPSQPGASSPPKDLGCHTERRRTIAAQETRITGRGVVTSSVFRDFATTVRRLKRIGNDVKWWRRG